jgi:hypothetical protein
VRSLDFPDSIEMSRRFLNCSGISREVSSSDAIAATKEFFRRLEEEHDRLIKQ